MGHWIPEFEAKIEDQVTGLLSRPKEGSTLKNTKEPSAPSELRYALHLIGKNYLVLAGTIISIASLLFALFATLMVNPRIWTQQNLLLRLCWDDFLFHWPIQNVYACPSNVGFPFGTDAYGRNLLQMIILAIPLDLEVAFAVVVIATGIGLVLGSIAAFLGGKIDDIIMRVTDVFFTIPSLLLAIILITVFGRTLFFIVIAMIIPWWPFYVRLTRGQILGEKSKLYVEALQAMGASKFRILFRHILPNSIYPILVNATLDIGSVILVFSGLTFLGFSPNPLLPELGNLVNSGIEYVFTAPWLIIFPGLTIFIISIGFNLLGDGIRDVLDPRLRR